MGMFSDLMGKIFAHAPAKTPASASPTATVENDAPVPTTVANPGTTPAPAPAREPVDVGAILDGLSDKSSEDLDWQTSIVDLLKLLDMDSSLAARKTLAKELAYPGDEADSGAMNVWLHRAVLKKLAENGGTFPAGLVS